MVMTFSDPSRLQTHHWLWGDTNSGRSGRFIDYSPTVFSFVQETHDWETKPQSPILPKSYGPYATTRATTAYLVRHLTRREKPRVRCAKVRCPRNKNRVISTKSALNKENMRPVN
ncbi:hypothetical protein IAQ61_011052 [Plenodomus lingam]|uniref:uncharacterized protein n=1 Tax=Leptosphaeria maculans TaxID=5022 RepID=UPI00332A0733|nr:hypothetical protein IAQ61_011052 [Plenodomus lingam]